MKNNAPSLVKEQLLLSTSEINVIYVLKRISPVLFYRYSKLINESFIKKSWGNTKNPILVYAFKQDIIIQWNIA